MPVFFPERKEMKDWIEIFLFAVMLSVVVYIAVTLNSQKNLPQLVYCPSMNSKLIVLNDKYYELKEINDQRVLNSRIIKWDKI